MSCQFAQGEVPALWTGAAYWGEDCPSAHADHSGCFHETGMPNMHGVPGYALSSKITNYNSIPDCWKNNNFDHWIPELVTEYAGLYRILNSSMPGHVHIYDSYMDFDRTGCSQSLSDHRNHKEAWRDHQPGCGDV